MVVDYETFQKILDQVALQLAEANQDGTLHEKLLPFGLQGLVDIEGELDLGSFDTALGDIFVLGDCEGMQQALKSVAESMGYEKNRFRFVEYGKIHQFDVSSLRYSTSVAAVMCGAVPHKATEMGDVSSLLEELRHSEEGYPPLEELRDCNGSGNLRITKTSFRAGLANLEQRNAIKPNHLR